MRSPDKPADGAPLKPSDFYILFSLLDGDRHGYRIAKEIREMTDGRIRMEAGNLHRTIQKLIRQGMVEAAEHRPAPDADDERRRYYTVTDRGRQAVADDASRMKELVRAVEARGLLPQREQG